MLFRSLEENLEEENKKIEAETASASNADEKRDTTVDSNETTESDLEKETATASNGKETPEIKRKMAKSALAVSASIFLFSSSRFSSSAVIVSAFAIIPISP